MSIQARLIKTLIKLTPNCLITVIANLTLRGIAKLSFFEFDIEKRTLNLSVRLLGEIEDITLQMADFGISKKGENLYFSVLNAQSNKPWLNNLMAHITQRAWPIPKIPQLAPVLPMVHELLARPEGESAAQKNSKD